MGADEVVLAELPTEREAETAVDRFLSAPVLSWRRIGGRDQPAVDCFSVPHHQLEEKWRAGLLPRLR